MQQQMSVPKVAASVLVALLCSSVAIPSAEAKKSDQEVFADIKKFEKCVIQATFNLREPSNYPPRTQAELERACKVQTEGIKCLKEKTKGAEPLLRRAMVTLAGTRSRQHRRLCSNPASEHAKKFVAASKCAMDAKAFQFKAIETVLAKTVGAIIQRNYNDSAPELKQLCCALFSFKQGILDAATQTCPTHRAMLEELVGSIITEDTTIVCEDDEKLSKGCPKLDRLSIDGIREDKVPSPSVAALYAFATLGEPSDEPLSFQ